MVNAAISDMAKPIPIWIGEQSLRDFKASCKQEGINKHRHSGPLSAKILKVSKNIHVYMKRILWAYNCLKRLANTANRNSLAITGAPYGIRKAKKNIFMLKQLLLLMPQLNIWIMLMKPCDKLILFKIK